MKHRAPTERGRPRQPTHAEGGSHHQCRIKFAHDLPDACRLEVEPGTYRARIYDYDQEDVSADALEGNDRYRVVLWRSDARVAPVVLIGRRTLLPSQAPAERNHAHRSNANE